jgi:hypothetical protein
MAVSRKDIAHMTVRYYLSVFNPFYDKEDGRSQNVLKDKRRSYEQLMNNCNDSLSNI